MVGQQLQRNRVEHRGLQGRRRGRQPEHDHSVLVPQVRIRCGHHEQPPAARPHFLKIRPELVQQPVVRRQCHHHHVLVHQRQRSVLQLAGRIGLGVDIGEFLQLQCAFHRHRPHRPASQEQHMITMLEVLGQPLELPIHFQQLLDQIRQRRGLLCQVAYFRLRLAPRQRQRQGHHRQGRQLGKQGLR